MGRIRGLLKKFAPKLHQTREIISALICQGSTIPKAVIPVKGEQTEEVMNVATASKSHQQSAPAKKKTARRSKPKRVGYVIQIGLDFGTSYCKCVCRDLHVDKAWVHISTSPADPEQPFLLPSALQVVGRSLRLGDPAFHYHEGGLPHVKVALLKVALGEWDDPVLKAFQAIHPDKEADQVRSFVVACAVFLIGGILGDVKTDIRKRFPGFGEHQDDYLGVNLAIPVEDAERPQINELFQSVLESAYEHADELADHPRMSLRSLSKLLPPQEKANTKTKEGDEFKCFIYPEVSAGVQGFVRTRVSSDGVYTYLFTETGAATVDQSVFILRRSRAEGDLLTYLHAKVHFLGSSHIERIAAELNGDVRPVKLENWRKLKESGEIIDELKIARCRIGNDLRRKSWDTLGVARQKLPVKEQFGDIQLLFGGGGHARSPYEEYVFEAFSDITLHSKELKPGIVGLPVPDDLQPQYLVKRWMARLCIAYGLSFWPGDFPKHTYPNEVPFALPKRPRNIEGAVTKEEC